MIRRIELVNFMSHMRTVIEPAEGLTVLVGPNNCGKSAVVTALQILCHNDNSTYVTRHNERECSVTIETTDGHTVQWARRNNSPRYIVDGRPFDRLDRNASPEGLHRILCLPKVTADGNREFDVHFGEQKSPVFLLDKPGSHAAQFFASSSDAASLVEMQKRHQQKMAEARKERVQLDAEAERLSRDLVALSAADDLATQIEACEAEHAALARQDTTIGRATDDARSLEAATRQMHRHTAECGALAALTAPPVLVPTEPLALATDGLTRLASELGQQAARADSVSNLRSPPELFDEAPLRGHIESLVLADRSVRRNDAECGAAKELRPPPLLPDTESLDTTARELARDARRWERLRSGAAALAGLTAPPTLPSETELARDLDVISRASGTIRKADALLENLARLTEPVAPADTAALASIVTDLDVVADRLKVAQQLTDHADAELQRAEEGLRRWAEENRVCPTCGGVLDPAEVVAHAQTHTGGAPHA